MKITIELEIEPANRSAFLTFFAKFFEYTNLVMGFKSLKIDDENIGYMRLRQFLPSKDKELETKSFIYQVKGFSQKFPAETDYTRTSIYTAKNTEEAKTKFIEEWSAPYGVDLDSISIDEARKLDL